MTPSAPTRREAWVILAAAFLGWMFAGVEMSLVVAATRPAIQEFQSTGVLSATGVSLEIAADHWFSWLLIAFFLGAAAGGALFGGLGDRFGRVKAMGASIVCYSAFTAISYRVATPEQLLVLRFLACLGVGGMWPNGVSLTLEAWPSVSRPMLAGLIGCSANIGFLILGAIMAYHPVTRDTWRWVLLFGGVPLLLGAAVLVLVPESKAWLAARHPIPVHSVPLPAPIGRATSPKAPLSRSQSLSTVFRHPYTSRTLLGIALGTIPLLGGWASGQRLVPWAGQVSEAAAAADLKATTLIVQSIGAVLGSLGGGWIASRLGPRRSYFLISLGSLCLSLAIFGGTRPGGLAFLPLTFLLGVVGVSFFGWLPYYLPGLFPTSIRATGTGVTFNFGRLVSALAVLVSAPLSVVFAGDIGRMGLATSLVYAAGLILAWLIPATSDVEPAPKPASALPSDGQAHPTAMSKEKPGGVPGGLQR
ncbi:MAG: MFS transporter [Verrucomicrobiales bacterium]|nr:MFS transporter [Verrucomicrobiales bacterium]